MVLGALLAESLQLVWPARCAACDVLVAEWEVFCPACRLSLCPLAGACGGCALPQPDANPTGVRCPVCRRVPFPFRGAWAAFEYGEAVADAIVRMKHGGRRDLGRRLARLLVAPLGAALVRGGFGADDVVLPVPLHPRRLRQRGFNQALELARWALRGVTRATRGPPLPAQPRLERRLLRRVRATRELGHAGPALRLAEVAGAFAVPDAGRVRGRRCLVVDDVFTTGATFSECAGALLGAGARSVDVLALARAV